MLMAGCSGADKKPPPAPKTESSLDRIIAVGKSWTETNKAEGFIDDSDIAFIRTTDQFVLRLKEGSRIGLVEITREELMRTRDGREFHCEVVGVVQASLRSDWKVGEPTLRVMTPEASLRRKCREPGINRPIKQFSPIDVTYVLRGDRLIAIEPARSRSSLLPGD